MFSLLNWFKSPPQRRKQTRFRGGVESLESRQLLAAVIGPVVWQSGPLGLDDIRGAASSPDGSEVRIVGQDDGSAAEQRIGVPTSPSGVLTPEAVELFWSLSQTANGGGSGFSGGIVHEIAYLTSGVPLRVGDSQDGLLPVNRTYWTTATIAELGGGSGVLGTAAPNGVFAGDNGTYAAVGSMTQPITSLVNSPSGGGIVDMTSDAAYLVGSGIWQATNVATLEYEVLDTTAWPVPDGALGLPPVWWCVAENSTGVYFTGEVIDAETFSSRVGVWKSDGTLIGVTDLGDTIADFDVFEDHLVLGVNGLAGGAVYILEGTTLGTRNDLSDELGTTDDVLAGTGTGQFFHSELGLIVTAGGLTRAVSLDFVVTPAAITVSSAVHQGSYAANVVSTRVSTFEVGLRGSATLDVTKLDRASLFIGDERNSVSGKILAIRYTDTNRDGFKDAIISVQSKTALRSDTTRLKITGRTTTGQNFNASRNVTSTSQTWIAHWQSTSGPTWPLAYTRYIIGLKRTWW